jgi:hypothetical protein
MIGHVIAKYRYRSAETGRFVSKDYAAIHPATTVRERIEERPQ